MRAESAIASLAAMKFVEIPHQSSSPQSAAHRSRAKPSRPWQAKVARQLAAVRRAAGGRPGCAEQSGLGVMR